MALPKADWRFYAGGGLILWALALQVFWMLDRAQEMSS